MNERMNECVLTLFYINVTVIMDLVVMTRWMMTDHCIGFHGLKMLEMSVTSGLYEACSIVLSEAHLYCDIISDFALNSISTTVK